MSVQTITQSIPLNRLVQSKTNVRRTGRSRSIETLMASIEAHGLRQNLNVLPTTGNRFEVVAGGRRLEALKRLAKDGRIDRDLGIPCVVLADNDNPAEISLAENTVREAMHPDDECTAFQGLVDGGTCIEDVAARFGVTPTVVRQRLKLASVSPVLRTRYRKGDLDLAQMMAFALVDDHAAQEAVWQNLPEWNRDPDAIRRNLTLEGVEASDKLAVLVGVEAYEAAGGVVLRDLFDDEQEAVLADSALVERLAKAKLETVATTLRREGWQWVEIDLDHTYRNGEKRVYADCGDDGIERFSAESLARAGARIRLTYEGQIEITRGIVSAKTVKAEARATANKDGKAVANTDLNASLVEDLTAHRTAALRFKLMQDNAVALATIVHALGLPLFYQSFGGSVLELHASTEHLDRHVKSKAECTAHAAVDAVLAELLETLPRHPSQFWDWCLTQSEDSLRHCLSVLAALMVNAVQMRHDARRDRLGHAHDLATVLGLDMHEHWTPTPEGFFSRLSKAQMMTFLREVDEPQHADVVARCKKPEAASRTGAALLSKGWLPNPLLNIAPEEEPRAKAVEVDVDDGDTDDIDD